jgi:predicted nucleic acid-binding protein
MIYLDSSAFFKLIVTEPETDALRSWLATHSDLPIVSSAIARTEVPRAVGREDPRALPRSFRIIRRVGKVTLTDDLLELAASLEPVTLRSLDAIHLASALTIKRDLKAFIAYDKRLLAVARGSGLPTASPGGDALVRPLPAGRTSQDTRSEGGRF